MKILRLKSSSKQLLQYKQKVLVSIRFISVVTQSCDAFLETWSVCVRMCVFQGVCMYCTYAYMRVSLLRTRAMHIYNFAACALVLACMYECVLVPQYTSVKDYFPLQQRLKDQTLFFPCQYTCVSVVCMFYIFALFFYLCVHASISL